MTRLTADERAAIQFEINSSRAEIARLADVEIPRIQADIDRLQAMLDVQPAGSDGDTIRMLQRLCSCGLPIDHRNPAGGEPLGCADETERIALPTTRSRPPVPGSVTRDESGVVQ